MKIGLGIDTGGTYTDAVMYDFDTKEIVCSVKAQTTKEDLSVGIGNALDGLPSDLLKKAELISLSTTLATNACVENKGGRAKLLFIGVDKKTADLVGADYGLPNVEEILFLRGKTNSSFEFSSRISILPSRKAVSAGGLKPLSPRVGKWRKTEESTISWLLGFVLPQCLSA